MEWHLNQALAPPRQMRKFNPGLLQSDDEVTAQFVVRSHEFRAVCEVVRSNIDSPSCQHTLIIGSRGQGKTTLLNRVALEIKTNAEFSRYFLPIRFMEENHEVDSLADFWMEILYQFAIGLIKENPELSDELSARHALLMPRWREQEFEGLVRAAVIEAADRIERRLVVLVENAQSLLGNTDETFGWGLRGILQTLPQITLVATAKSRFDALFDPQAPFFHFFRLIELNPLNTAECRRLWEFVRRTETMDVEIRPLEILTGGNPRLIVIIASIANHRSIGQLMEDLVVMIDENTDYFRGMLDSLPKQERRVFIALIDLWQASNTTAIAARARMDVRVVSTMISRLIQRGVVTIVADNGKRKRLYASSERLFSIYYKLRRERDESAIVEALVQFMASFYTVDDVNALSEELREDAHETIAIQMGIGTAIENHGNFVDSDSRDKIAAIDSALPRSPLMEELLQAHNDRDSRKMLNVAERIELGGILSNEPTPDEQVNQMFIEHARSIAHLRLEAFGEVIKIGEKLPDNLDQESNTELIREIVGIKINQAWSHLNLGEISSAKQISESLIQRENDLNTTDGSSLIRNMRLILAHVAEAEGNIRRAIELFDEVITQKEDSDNELSEWELASCVYNKIELESRLDLDASKSLIRFDSFIERFENEEKAHTFVIGAMWKKGISYGRLGNFEKELACFDNVIQRVNDRFSCELETCIFNVLMQKGRRLAELGNANEALSCCEESHIWLSKNQILTVDSNKKRWDWYVNCTRALALTHLGVREKANEALQTAYRAFNHKRGNDLMEFLRLCGELLAAGARTHDLLEVIESDESHARHFQSLVICLQRRARDTLIAPREVIDVANDLDRSINYRLRHGLQQGYVLPRVLRN